MSQSTTYCYVFKRFVAIKIAIILRRLFRFVTSCDKLWLQVTQFSTGVMIQSA